MKKIKTLLEKWKSSKLREMKTKLQEERKR